MLTKAEFDIFQSSYVLNLKYFVDINTKLIELKKRLDRRTWQGVDPLLR